MRRSQLKALIKEIVSSILEDPDNIVYTDPISRKTYKGEFQDNEGIDSVVIFCQDYKGTQYYFAYRPAEAFIYSNNPQYEDAINRYIADKGLYPFDAGEPSTHGRMLDGISAALPSETWLTDDYWEKNRLLHARVYEVGSVLVFTCWQELAILKKHKPMVDELMQRLNYKTETLLFEPINYDSEPLAYWEVFGGTQKKPSSTDKDAMQWKEKLHLNPDLKKAVLKIPPHRIQKAADKIDMPLAQLKQLAGFTFENKISRSTLKALIKEIVQQTLKENIINRFFWMDPDGKMHPVAVYKHGEWASEYLTRKNKYPDDGDIYGAMADLKWYRVGFTLHLGKKTVEYDFPKSNPPSNRQVKSLKDLAIELEAEEILPRGFD